MWGSETNNQLPHSPLHPAYTPAHCIFYECHRHNAQRTNPNPNPQAVPQTDGFAIRIAVAVAVAIGIAIAIAIAMTKCESDCRVQIRLRVQVEAGARLAVAFSMVQLSLIETLIASSWRPKAFIVSFHSWTPQLARTSARLSGCPSALPRCHSAPGPPDPPGPPFGNGQLRRQRLP